jgi:hypothetical protein
MSEWPLKPPKEPRTVILGDNFNQYSFKGICAASSQAFHLAELHAIPLPITVFHFDGDVNIMQFILWGKDEHGMLNLSGRCCPSLQRR